MEASELIASFGECVDRHEATVLVGAGMSRDVGYPDWSGLMEMAREELGLPEMADLPLLAQYYINEHGEGQLQEIVREELRRDPSPHPSECHRLLASLPLTEIWTTNYDDLIERAIGDGAHAYSKDDDLAGATEEARRRVYKMHGSLNETEHLTIARDQYIRYPDTHQRFWALLQASFLTKSFLFLGFSFSDPNFDHVFQIVRRARHDIHRRHFALMRTPPEARERPLFTQRLKDLERIGINVATIDEHSEMEALLKQLAARCRPRRLFISGSPASDRPVPSDDSYPSSDLPPEMSGFADQLGDAFQDTSVALSAGGSFGARVGYALLGRLQKMSKLNSERFMLLRRCKDQPLNEPSHRYGSIVFRGSTADELRDAAFAGARAILAVGGGSGTAVEIRKAREEGLGVVPIGTFGGSALEEWTRMNENLDAYRLGGIPVDPNDFGLLRDGNQSDCASAAARLAEQALYIRREE